MRFRPVIVLRNVESGGNHQPEAKLRRKKRHRSPDVHRTGGFTLIELVMVVLVIGILGAIVAPRFASKITQHSVTAVGTLLQTELLAAQQEAIATSASVTMTISRQTHTYSLSANRNGIAQVIRDEQLSGDPWNCKIDSLLKGSARTSVESITLVVNGAGVFAEDLVINLSAGTSTGKVTVYAATGRIVLE